MDEECGSVIPGYQLRAVHIGPKGRELQQEPLPAAWVAVIGLGVSAATEAEVRRVLASNARPSQVAYLLARVLVDLGEDPNVPAETLTAEAVIILFRRMDGLMTDLLPGYSAWDLFPTARRPAAR